MMKKLSYKNYNEPVTTRDNGNVQFHDKEESKSRSTINANNDAHTLTHDQIKALKLENGLKKHFQNVARTKY